MDIPVIPSPQQRPDGMLARFLWRYEYDIVEVINAFTGLGLGILFFLHVGPYTDSSTPPAFGIDPNLLGVVSVAFGFLSLVAFTHRSIRLRKWSTLTHVFLWAFYAILFQQGMTRPFLGFILTELSLFSLWAYVRLVIRHRAQRYLDPRDAYNAS